MTNKEHIVIRPLGDRLAVLLDSKREESVGGIVIPDKSQDVPTWGTVFAAGPKAKDCVVNDRVYVPTHLGTSYTVTNGPTMVVIEESKVVAREERSYKLPGQTV